MYFYILINSKFQEELKVRTIATRIGKTDDDDDDGDGGSDDDEDERNGGKLV